MGRLRRKSSTAKEGSQKSGGQTAIDQFFSKGPAQRKSLFTQVGVPAWKGPGSSKGPSTSAAGRTKPNQPAAQPDEPCCSVSVVPETQLTCQVTSDLGRDRSEVVVIPDTQAAGTQLISEFPDDSSDFVMTKTPTKHKPVRKTQQATVKPRGGKLSLRGRGACKENVAKQLGRSAGKRSSSVLEDVSSKSPDNVPGEEGASACLGSYKELSKSPVIDPEGTAKKQLDTRGGCHDNHSAESKYEEGASLCLGSSKELSKSLVIDPEGATNKQVNIREGCQDNHSAEAEREYEGCAGKRTSSDTAEQEEGRGADAVTMVTLVQSDSPEIVPEAQTRARVKQNIRSLATRTKQNSYIVTDSTDCEKDLALGENDENSDDGTENILDDGERRGKLVYNSSGSSKEGNRTTLGGKKWLSWTGSLLGKRSPARGSSPDGKRSRTPDAPGTQEQVKGKPSQAECEQQQAGSEISQDRTGTDGEDDVSTAGSTEGRTDEKTEEAAEMVATHPGETSESRLAHLTSPLTVKSKEDIPPANQQLKQTSATVEPQLIATETDKPIAIETNKPVSMATDKPVAMKTDKPVAKETDKLTATETVKTVATETDKPLVTEKVKPVAMGADKPVSMGTNKQIAMETDKLVATETDTPVAMATADPSQQGEVGADSAEWEDLNDSFFDDLAGGSGADQDLARSFSQMSPFKGSRGTGSTSDPTSDPTLGTAEVCTKLSRFRVQGVETEEHDGYVTQLTLQLTNPAHHSSRTCVLRDGWAGLSVQSGDIVHVLAEFGADGVGTVDRDRGYVVVTPDLLMSSTAVANGIKCLRRAVLSERFKGTDGSSKQMLLGTILHDVFQAATSTSFSADSLKQISQQALQKQRHLRDMFSLSLTQSQLQEEIGEYLPVMRSWADTFYRSRGAEMEVKLPGVTYRNRVDERSNVVVSDVRDIEENVWAPSRAALKLLTETLSALKLLSVTVLPLCRFGLKGKLDVTTEVRIQPRQKGRDPLQRILPLELKTGRETNSIEHRSQVILYTLLTREHHPDPELGLLLYLKTGNMKAVPAGHMDRRELLLIRNRLATQLKHSLQKDGDRVVPTPLPPVINDPRGCKYCSQLPNCALYNRAFETEEPEGSMSALLRQETSHLKTSHLQYFCHWYLLVLLEDRETSHKSHLAHLWTKPAQDREKSGDCVPGLQLTRCASGADGDFTCTLRRKQNPGSQTSLRLSVEDYILISIEERNMVAMCSGFLTELGEETLSVRVDRDLSKFPPDTVFTLDKKDGYSSTGTSLANLARLMGNTAAAERLRELIIEQQEPRFHTRVSDMCPADAREAIGKILKGMCPAHEQDAIGKILKGVDSHLKVQSLIPISKILKGLNQPQKQAIKKVLMARDYTLIVGMPGTGKTTSIVALVRILLACGNSVLLTSYTNSAVDNVLLKLSKYKLDFLRLGSSSRVHPGVAPHTEDRLARGLTTVEQLDKLYVDKPIVATTCLGAKHPLFSRRKFDVCIVDEASQIAQPVCLGPLVHATRFVLVGDHQQLPPLVQSGTARRMGMDESLFKKMGHHQSATAQLNVQYRMNSDIMELSNTLMYDGKLCCGSDKVAAARLDLPAWDQLEAAMLGLGVASSWIREALRPDAPVRFLDTDKVPALETSEQGGLSNRTEAQLVRTLTSALVQAGCPQEDIGIIAPYRRQLRVLSDLLQGAGCPGMENSTGYPGVEINTVDKYQGRDKSVIMVTFVRSNSAGQLGELLQDWRRLNVAITRAKHKLLLIGSVSTLRRYEPVARLLDHLTANQMVLELPPGAENIPSNF
ncbi:Tripartite DNA replication factor [Branchiostoma belcheri]|nr:Tripartite DNA replication factor [Branchiostoma belcheri]